MQLERDQARRDQENEINRLRRCLAVDMDAVDSVKFESHLFRLTIIYHSHCLFVAPHPHPPPLLLRGHGRHHTHTAMDTFFTQDESEFSPTPDTRL